MIDDNGIALDNAFDIGITASASVRDLVVLKDFDGLLHCIDSAASIFEEVHALLAGPGSF
jgi:hypothetical protein